MLTRFSLAVMLLAFMAIVQVQATATQGADLSIVLLRRLYEIHYPVKRQATNSTNSTVPLSDFPQQCQGGCKLSIDALNACSSATCLCNSTVEASLSYCINCSVNTVPTTTVIQSGQQVVDTYNTLCKGVTGVPSIILNITVATEATSTSSSGAVSSVGIGSGSSISLIGSGPTTTITSLPSILAPGTGGGSGAAATSGPAASTAVSSRADIGYAFIVLITALVVPLLA